MPRAAALRDLIAAGLRRQRRALAIAGAAAVAAAVASAGLLGLSGWFIAASAVAGSAGLALGFNYLLPSAAIRLFAIVRTVGRYGEQVSGHEAALATLARIRPMVFRALAAAPVVRALSLSTGEASARLVQDVDAMETLIVRRPARWGAGAAVVGGLGLTGLAGWPAALSTAIFCAAVLVVGRATARRLADAPGREAQRASGRLKERFTALAAAAPELRCLDLELWAVEAVQGEADDLDLARQAAGAARGWQAALLTASAGLAAAAALALAHGGAPLALMAALVAAVTVEGAGGLARHFFEEGAMMEAESRLDWLMRSASSAAPARTPPDTVLGLDLPGGRRLLHPGDRLAIVGRSGCGKTTVLEQLLCLRDAPRGTLWIGGLDVTAMAPWSARALFAYAPQEPTLVSGSFRDNLTIADPDADDMALWSALTDAGLAARVRAAPPGLDTWIGDGGERLSGGERRRLNIARALLKPAPWLLLDEPTEGLDAATESLVIERLPARLARTGQGLILVSHRPAALALCDQVIDLENAERPAPIERTHEMA
jgi:ATP-binding cassette subfamily C protein CydC